MQSTQTHLAVTAGSTAPSTGTPGKSSSASAIAISHKTLIMFVILVIIESLTTAAFTKRILKRIHTECYLMSREVTSGPSMFFKYSSYLITNPFAVTFADYRLNVWVFSASLHVNTSTFKPAMASKVKYKN